MGGPATSLRILTGEFTGVAALPYGGFLIAADLGDVYEPGTAGLMRVSANGIVASLLCASSAYARRLDGRDLYLSGRAVSDAFIDVPPSDLAVTADGCSCLVASEAGSTTCASARRLQTAGPPPLGCVSSAGYGSRSPTQSDVSNANPQNTSPTKGQAAYAYPLPSRRLASRWLPSVVLARSATPRLTLVAQSDTRQVVQRAAPGRREENRTPPRAAHENAPFSAGHSSFWTR